MMLSMFNLISKFNVDFLISSSVGNVSVYSTDLIIFPGTYPSGGSFGTGFDFLGLSEAPPEPIWVTLL